MCEVGFYVAAVFDVFVEEFLYLQLASDVFSGEFAEQPGWQQLHVVSLGHLVGFFFEIGRHEDWEGVLFYDVDLQGLVAFAHLSGLSKFVAEP